MSPADRSFVDISFHFFFFPRLFSFLPLLPCFFFPSNLSLFFFFLQSVLSNSHSFFGSCNDISLSPTICRPYIIYKVSNILLCLLIYVCAFANMSCTICYSLQRGHFSIMFSYICKNNWAYEHFMFIR